MKVGRCINMARSISGRISKPSQAFQYFSSFNVRLTMPMQYLNFSLPTQRCELRWEQLQRELPRWPTGCEADFVLTLFVFFLSKTVFVFLWLFSSWQIFCIVFCATQPPFTSCTDRYPHRCWKVETWTPRPQVRSARDDIMVKHWVCKSSSICMDLSFSASRGPHGPKNCSCQSE